MRTQLCGDGGRAARYKRGMSHHALPLASFEPARYTDAEAALRRVIEIYEHSIASLRDALRRFVAGEP
ncbi:hypothetical protein Q0P12_14785, partial [Staphylococcus aureus]|nr:hypothetical protein [Staphylococcus aureus]